MGRPEGLFSIQQRTDGIVSWGDLVVVLVIAVGLYAGVQMAKEASSVIKGPKISLAPDFLPWYATLSVGRMAAAYALSLIFSLTYGYLAVRSLLARSVLLPLLDVLQSVPILSFLPVVLLSLSAVLPQNLAAEIASIVLIFTSQAWNMTFAWYQSLTTIPSELEEASLVFRFNGWLRFRNLDLPFGAISLIWNSIMSWAGGWFFLMAAEIFTVGDKDFRLPGLGAYLKEAANQGDMAAIGWGVATLVLLIVALDHLVWRPLVAWSERFKLEMVESAAPRSSWFYDALRTSHFLRWMNRAVCRRLLDFLDSAMLKLFPMSGDKGDGDEKRPWWHYILGAAGGVCLLYGAHRAGVMLLTVSIAKWGAIGMGLAATLLRVLTALVIALSWTIPLGVAIGTNVRLASLLQPIVQVTASVPATALFPIFLLFMLHLPGGLNLVAVFLMLMGTQWYLLFNIIAGASSIPQDLKYTATLLNLSRWKRWQTLILPALFPYVITGAIAASGGAWNASIVAEHVEFAGKTLQTTGIGAIIAEATASGDYPLLLAATLSMIFTVVGINRYVWRRMYRLAEEKYHME